MFEKYGTFRADLGPSPDHEIPRPNEDTEFGRRLLAAGERLRNEPSAVVHHQVVESRINKQYLLNWSFDLGRAGIREAGRRPDICGVSRPYLMMLKEVMLLGPVRTVRWILSWNAQQRFYYKGWVWKTVGEITEIYRCWFSKSVPVEIYIQQAKRELTNDSKSSGSTSR